MAVIAKITVNDNRFLTIEAMPQTLDLIDEFFTYEDMSLCFMGGSFKRENIIRKHFLVRKKEIRTSALLPIGFKDDLEQWLKFQKALYKIIDERKFEVFNLTTEEITNSLNYLTLHDYQVEAIQACLDKKCGIIKSPTGSGKTEMFITLCKILNKKTLVLFARIDLAHQTLRRMQKAQLDAGIVQGNNIDENHQIVMATVQSAHKLQDKYEVVIVDEVHRAVADQYQEILRCSMFKYRFGFSATPWTKDKYKNAKVKSWIGDEIYAVPPQKLIEAKQIAKPIIHIYPIDRPRGLENYKWMGAEKHGIVENKYRNDVITKLCGQLKGQILILIKKIDQGKNLFEKIPSAHFLYGDIDQKERTEITKRFDSGEDFVLIASTIFDEGIDIRNVNHVFIVGGGSSFIKALQRVGRGTRVTETKKQVDIYDFWDDINPILLKHSRERIKIYRKYGFEDVIFHEDSEVKKLLL
jgi:superfamily II DNA or RNA helicase